MGGSFLRYCLCEASQAGITGNSLPAFLSITMVDVVNKVSNDLSHFLHHLNLQHRLPQGARTPRFFRFSHGEISAHFHLMCQAVSRPSFFTSGLVSGD
jgi:hypothetical protein